eukprot:GHVU01216828.1.p1 GENE.GHVU01216828.1~~GHVU01216828.1.p1  ORF type:complete len:386 (+),score=45.14 GHVU01216828.1:468-1625(+)
MFGNLRQRTREFTTKQLIEFIGRLEITFKNMMKFDIVGTREHRGYLNGFSGYREQWEQVLRAGGPAPSPAVSGTSFSVDVDYECSGGRRVGAQLESRFVEMVGVCSADMEPFLRSFGCTELSPFCKSFKSLEEVAKVYFTYMGSKYGQKSRHSQLWPLNFANSPVDVEDGDSEDGDDAAPTAADADNEDIVAMVETFARHVGEKEPEEDLEVALVCDDDGPVVEDVFNCSAFRDLICFRMDGGDGARALAVAHQCLAYLQAKERGQADGVQKFKSLTGRWFAARASRGEGATRIGTPESVRNHMLKRDDIVYLRQRYYRVTTVYKKSYRKWRMEASAPPANDTVVHVVHAVFVAGAIRENSALTVRTRCVLMRGDMLAEALMIIV